jgi:tetratricopeptide (TPR) repeat protein
MAKNLLGLLYVEIGMIGEGYKQFTISDQIQTVDNKAREYMVKISKSSRELQKVKDSIICYNKGLDFLIHGNDDMALIQLKRSVDLNPKFINALNLLALCHIYRKQEAKAQTAVKKVLNMDINNPTALRYRNSISNIPDKNESIIAVKKNRESKPVRGFGDAFNKPQVKKLNIMTFIFIGFGFLLGFIVIYLLIIPPMANAHSSLIAEKNSQIEEYGDRQAELETENVTLTDDLERANQLVETISEEIEEQIALNAVMLNLNDASELMSTGDYEAAAQLLFYMDRSVMSPELTTMFDRMVMRSYPIAANILYERGRSYFRAWNLEEAEVAFNECLKFANRESHEAGDATFYLAEISWANEDVEGARMLYTRVYEEFPNAHNHWMAGNRLDTRF